MPVVDTDSSDDENKSKNVCKNYFLTELAEWIIMTHQTRDASGSLLKILAKSNRFLDFELPVDPRTLYGVPIKINPENKCGGRYVYFGLTEFLTYALSTVNEQFISCLDAIKIDVNVDGLPLTKSSSNEFWLILCSLVDIKCTPFVVALYCGKHKPNSSAEYLNDFVSEVNDLQRCGFNVSNEGL
jgi:hypothetical protein